MTKKKPIFEQIAEEIRKKVNDGFYTTSQKLPSEYDLADEYGVSRLTVRKAINFLINQNVLIKQSGKGTYIMRSPKNKKGLSDLLSFSEAAKFYGEEPSAEIISVEEPIEIPQEISEALELTEDEKVIHVVRVRSLNKEPMTLENLYIIKKYLTDTSIEELEKSIFAQIENKIGIAYSHQEVEAVLITEKLSKLLKVKENEPALKSIAVTYSADAKPILYDITYHRGDQYSFKKTVHRY